MIDLNKHIVKDNDDKPFHSSGFAQIANGNRIGSVGRLSFEQRQLLDQRRQTIGNYRSSAIGGIHNTHKTPIDPIAPKTPTIPVRPVVNSRQQLTAPPARNYNPFA